MGRLAMRGRGRMGASLVATMAMFGGAAAVTGGTAASAVPPPDDCRAAAGVGSLTDGEPVHGLTVVSGTTPVSFTGEILGVINDGIAADLDMVMARLDIDQIDDGDGVPGVEDVTGIWQGMSGSPVYDADDKLIGAVAYGLIWGETNVAGITPFEEMDNYLPGAAASRVPVSDRKARQIAEDSDVTARQASQGFAKLGVPLGVSGIGHERLQKAYRKQADRRGNYLYKNAYPMSATGAGDGVSAGEETLVAGGNLGATMSHGTVTMGGVGTVTNVCNGGLVGFGHPAGFTGDTTMSMHPAEALFIQPGGLDAPFKVANLAEPSGVIDGDHLSGISGTFGGTVPETEVVTSVRFGDRVTKPGLSHVTVPDASAPATFYQHIAIHDRAVDAIRKGSELMTWSISGDDNGRPFNLGMTDRYASSYDITFESPWDVADTVWLLSSLPGVTVEEVTSDAEVFEDHSTWNLDHVEQWRGDQWVTVSRRRPALATAGRVLRVRAVLETASGATKNRSLTFRVPARASGSVGALEVTGGAWTWLGGRVNSVADVSRRLAHTVRNDEVEGQLMLEGRNSRITRRDVTKPANKVVQGRKMAMVLVR